VFIVPLAYISPSPLSFIYTFVIPVLPIVAVFEPFPLTLLPKLIVFVMF
jgi:hypothetical protein